jgi:hypothetical protein
VTEETKHCARCDTDKPLSEFHKDRTTRDGLQWQCAACNTKMAAQWNREHPDQVAAREKANREKRNRQKRESRIRREPFKTEAQKEAERKRKREWARAARAAKRAS